MDKVKIGDNEYRLPIWCTTTKILSPFTETSPNMSERNFVTNEDITTALNELASLRAENEAFREDHHKHDEWMAWAQSYFNDNPDLCMWGSRLDVGIRETLIMRDQEIAQLRAERDALKARVEELTGLSDRLAYVVAVCENWDIFPLEGCDDVDDFLDDPVVTKLVSEAKESMHTDNDGVAWLKRNTTPGGDE